MGSNRRYAANIDRQMDRRIIESVMADHAPETLKDAELELDTELLVRPDRAVPCTAWVRYNGVPVSVGAEAVAWTPRAVAVRWKTPTNVVHKAWVWASAVRR